MSAPDHGIGARVLRREDRRFLRGEGTYTSDLVPAGAAHAAVVRSPHPHALIVGLDVSRARDAPGVRMVLTAETLAEAGVGPVPSLARTAPFEITNLDGTPSPDGSQFPLARDRVRYLGEGVAMVVADTVEQAVDAAAKVDVDYTVLPAVMTFAEAMAPGATRIWDEHPNRSLDWACGDADAVDSTFSTAAHVVEVDLDNNRIAPAFLEPRSAWAHCDADTGRLTLTAGSQGAHGLQATLASMIDVDPAMLRVVTPDTGGGFGARNCVYPEFPVLLVAARHLGRAVHWCAERSESFLTDFQARDSRLRGGLALDEDGRFLAIRMTVDWRHGGYLPGRMLWVMTSYLPPTVGGVYRIPHGTVRLRGAFTNTTPQVAFRGIGRMESTYVTEALVDAAAIATGIDRLDLRRRNLVGAADMPWTAPGGATYRSGAFATVLDRALARAGYGDFEARRQDSLRDGRRRGLGIALFIENDGGAPSEFAQVAVRGDGGVTVAVGTQDFGMGHATVYSQIAAEQLGVPFDDIEVIEGDTDRVRSGAGSHGSRSARIGGTAVVRGVEAVIEQGRSIAADLLEAAVPDVEFDVGRYVIAGTDRAVALIEVALAAEQRGTPLDASARFDTVGSVHSNGCQICEVEVDPDTGRVTVLRHTVVADVGRALNPMIVEGQLHGGASQGIGQALLEQVAYDPATGQTLTGSLMDYTLARADDLPSMETELVEIHESDNPLGVKGAGEGATTGAPAAVMSAVRDALGPAASGLQLPLTPLRVWTALRAPGKAPPGGAAH